jgi:AcrR family transcriptional regulator
MSEHTPVGPLAQPQKGRKHTQRERIVNAMIDAAGQGGYEQANVSAVIARAGVSRPTFYDYFDDREDCFIAALSDIHAQLLSRIVRAIEEQEPKRALEATISAMLEFAEAEPAQGRVLMNEPMVCTGRSLDTRDRGIAEIAQLVEGDYERAPASAVIPDFPTRVLIGGLERMIGFHLVHSGHTTRLTEGLLDWTNSYARPLGEHRWRPLTPLPQPPPSTIPEEVPLRPAMAGEPQRKRLSAEGAEGLRRRILLAAAQVAVEKGCKATTMIDISERCEINVRTLRKQFRNPPEVFTAVHELHFQSMVAVTASAFARGASWPERVWQAGRAFAQSIEQNLSFAHISFIEYHAAGRTGVERNSELLMGFTLFLQEGYQYELTSGAPSPVALAAIAASNFEAVYQRIRGGGEPRLPGLLPHAVYLELAPFLGASETNRFIDEMLHREGIAPTP